MVWTVPPGAVQETMILLYLSLPFMLIGITIALAPLLWAMTHRERLHDVAIPAQVHPNAPARGAASDGRAA